MKEYIGIKVIKAEPMSLGDYNNFRGWKIPEDEDPKREGYKVMYKDGYISWSPKEIFEKSYVISSNKLVMTALDMKSDDYKKRFKAEYDQLVLRIEGLENMLLKYKNGTLRFKPMCPYTVLSKQLAAMKVYRTVLEERAKIEDIEL